MACCIFVAFIFSQLMAACEAVRRFFGGKPEDKAAAAQAWRLDNSGGLAATPSAAASKTGLQRRKPSLVAVVAIGLALVIAVGIWFT
jgi:ferric-dicitrate binding protein FerR (iron transport regulator)